MTALCRCGHEQKLHFAGTAGCHFNVAEDRGFQRCPCSTFVAAEPVTDRADIA